MFEKIVLATDLSPAWDEIVACAGEFKGLGCTQVILAHVITVRFLAGMEAALRAEAEPRLAEQKKILEAQGLKVTVEMPFGLPAYALNEVARRHEADLLVVGSHGKSLWREGVLGSVSSAVLHHTVYPTLLLKIKVDEEKEKGTCRLHCTEMLRHILFPTDFSEIGERALGYVERLAQKGATRVTLCMPWRRQAVRHIPRVIKRWPRQPPVISWRNGRDAWRTPGVSKSSPSCLPDIPSR